MALPRGDQQVIAGAERRLEVPMSDTELAGLRASADRIRTTARDLGF